MLFCSMEKKITLILLDHQLFEKPTLMENDGFNTLIKILTLPLNKWV